MVMNKGHLTKIIGHILRWTSLMSALPVPFPCVALSAPERQTIGRNQNHNHESWTDLYAYVYVVYVYAMQSKYIPHCFDQVKNERKKWKCPFHLNLQDGVQHIIQAPPIVAADQWGWRWPSPLCSRWSHQVIIGLVLLSSSSSISFWSYLGVIRSSL